MNLLNVENDASSTGNVQSALDTAKQFIGGTGRAFRNDADDLVVQSEDGTREIRFDFNRTRPHRNPHVHVIKYKRLKNNKRKVEEERIWPSDVAAR